MEDPRKLRELAGWSREFAERAGNPAIWEARLRTAKDGARGRSLGKDGGPGPREIAERSR
jgi:hypothetical protein